MAKPVILNSSTTGELLPATIPATTPPTPAPQKRKAKSGKVETNAGAAPSPRAEPRFGTTPPLGEREKESTPMDAHSVETMRDGAHIAVDGASTATGGAPVLPAREACALPGMIEFKPLNSVVMWRVEKFELLAVEFGLRDAACMAQFMFLAERHPRLWLLARRLYGVGPVIPAGDATPDDLRVWTRSEMEAEGYSVKADLEALRGFWLNYCTRDGALRPDDEGIVGNMRGACTPKEELELDDKLLEQFNFSERMFEITVFDPKTNSDVLRPAAENRAERAWFIRRVKEWSKMLSDSMGGHLARSALMNDLAVHRLEADLAVAPPKQRAALYEQLAAQTQNYRESVAELQKMFPEMAVAGRVSFRGVVSDLIAAHRDYYGQADRRLVDKVFTATEIEFLTRSSEQVEARYRFSLNVAIISCINGLYDQNFKPLFKPKVLKLMDAGFNGALAAARAATREKLVDLENGVLPGEGDDFEDFNDAACPHCGARISSQAKRCPECRKPIREKAESENRESGNTQISNDEKENEQTQANE